MEWFFRYKRSVEIVKIKMDLEYCPHLCVRGRLGRSRFQEDGTHMVFMNVERKERRNWKISGRQSCGNGPTGITRASTPSTKLMGPMLEEKSADSHQPGANGKSRRRSVDKVSNALCGSPGED